MDWVDERYEQFVDATIRMAVGRLPGYAFPHVILPYSPSAERTCISHVRMLPGRLTAHGLKSHLVPVGRVVAEVMPRWAKQPLAEAADYASLANALADVNAGLVPKVAEAIHREVSDVETVIVLARLGALYPFAHVSSLLDALHGRGVRNTIAAVYPGTADGMNLSFLGMAHPTGGYRGCVIQ